MFCIKTHILFVVVHIFYCCNGARSSCICICILYTSEYSFCRSLNIFVVVKEHTLFVIVHAHFVKEHLFSNSARTLQILETDGT